MMEFGSDRAANSARRIIQSVINKSGKVIKIKVSQYEGFFTDVWTRQGYIFLANSASVPDVIFATRHNGFA